MAELFLANHGFEVSQTRVLAVKTVFPFFSMRLLFFLKTCQPYTQLGIGPPIIGNLKNPKKRGKKFFFSDHSDKQKMSNAIAGGFLIPSDEKTPLKSGCHLSELMKVDQRPYSAVHFEVDGTHCLMFSETEGALNSRATRFAGVTLKGDAVVFVYGCHNHRITLAEVEEMIEMCGVYPLPEGSDKAVESL
jgi:hypothetical protein